MKKLMVIILLAGAFQAMSQNFEGTIKWTMKLDVTDPKLKAEMAKAQQPQKLDPAQEAKMKEMEAKMKDPQFKAMMEANPQMKAQIENMMKMAQGGTAPSVNSMMPSGFIIRMKNQNSLSKMEGGMMSGRETLYQKDKNQTVMLDRENKTYSIFPSAPGSTSTNAAATAAKVTKTSETTKILGYTCTKYTAEVTEGGHPATQVFWATTEIKDFDFKSLANQRMGQGPSWFNDKVEGIPLKIEMTMPQGNMVMEVTDIKKESLNAADFTIPSDYKEVKMPMMPGRN